MRGSSGDEFPLLSAMGLYAADIRGDGNCLFNALSDQLYGNQGQHHIIRARVIDYMREHADYYKQFIDVYPGGGLRRNPKRKNAGAYSTPTTFTPPSQAEIDRVFEGHLQSMAKGGTYGDNMEITAFSSAYDCDVKIYHRDYAYMVSALGDSEDDGKRQVAHIAYHTWEHYSSIRNLDGPHAGMPNVRIKPLSPEEEEKQKEKLAHAPRVLPWMVDVVASSLPFLADKVAIKRTLEECKGNVDAAVSKLLDAEDRGSVTSAQESSSVEREPDSDDEAIHGPNKKRDRRMSRAAKNMHKSREPTLEQINAQFAAHSSNSQESIASVESGESTKAQRGEEPPDDTTSSQPGTSSQVSNASAATDQEGTDAVDIDARHIKAEDSASERSQSRPRGAPRLKLNPPKPPPSPLSITSNVSSPTEIGESSRPASKQHAANPHRRVTARERKEMKKQAQKQARKERAQATSSPAKNSKSLPILVKGITNQPMIESGFRTLYI